MNDPSDSIEVARHLLEFASRVEPIELMGFDFPVPREKQEQLLNESAAVRYVSQAEKMIGA